MPSLCALASRYNDNTNDKPGRGTPLSNAASQANFKSFNCKSILNPAFSFLFMTSFPKFSSIQEFAEPPSKVSFQSFRSPPCDLHKANASHIACI